MYLIAEIGINANGSLEKALEMCRVAKDCGADYVKFQKRDINAVYTKEFLDSPRESPFGTTQRHQKEGLEFSYADYQAIDNYCKGINLKWFASSWDNRSLEMMDSFDPPFHKVASAFNNHREFLCSVGALKRPVILSTGMASANTISLAIRSLREGMKGNYQPIILMHCVSIYPCPDELCNIKAIWTLQDQFEFCEVGYSGHERGIAPTLAAITIGATYIERHFTLDRADYGSDQAASLEPRGLARIREYGDQIISSMGDGEITVLDEELKCARSLRYWE